MRFGPLTFRDRTGADIVIRNAAPEDADALIRYLKVISAETPYLVREPEEITITAEAERAFLEGIVESERDLMLAAFADGRHIGNCSIMSVGPQLRYRHRCSVGIALYREFWGRGIGRKMMETALDAARQAGYEQAELEAVAGNTAAVSLYESLGFVTCGTLPCNMKYKDGRYADTVWMMKRL
ncbi:MAG: GNAT family N-acetyltransferase [Clostridiales bacterium]|nr:GNAT family N-acetyltransferase [Clostridiales bacterium]